MPFTLSHAAAALPFRRTRLIMSAVVVGCFAPDFEYFLGIHGGFGHTLTGILVFDLPLALAVLWLFHRYAKEPLAACLPEGTRERLHLRSLSIDSVSRLAMVILSILAGIATHILWDSFTHPRYWLYAHWHFLSETIRIPLFGDRPWFAIFQYVSSVLGLLVILLWWIQWYRNTPPHRSRSDQKELLTRDRVAVACAFVIALLAAAVRAVVYGIPHGISGSQKFLTIVVVTALTAFWGEVILYGLVRNRTRSPVKVT
ncbi:MAG TPA: DUF4184 family protein [Acidobacteriaceae bacterium]|nr:DUF4184 family protein [Acidobacteriaceae bacterium]